MRYSDILKSVTAQFKAPAGTKVVPYIEGAPGGGKSALARDIALTVGIEPNNIHQFFVSLRDPVDLMGTPAPNNDVTRWRPPEELTVLSSGRHCLILEELPDATIPMQNAACGLIYDRKVNSLKLSDQVYIIATGNRAKDKSGANRMTSKLRGRVRSYEFTENIDDWSDWALRNNIRVDLIQFLRFRPDLLSAFDPDRVCPTPRNWERVALIPEDLPQELFFGTVAGDVGEGGAAEFTAFIKTFRSLPNIDNLIMNPEKAEVPTQPAVLYALTGALARRIDKDNFDRVYKYIDRLAPEFQVMCVRDAIKLKPDLMNTKTFVQWSVANASVII